MHETKHWSVWSIHSSHMEICIKVVNGYGQVHSMSPILYETVHRDPPLNLQYNHILTFPSSFRNPAATVKKLITCSFRLTRHFIFTFIFLPCSKINTPSRWEYFWLHLGKLQFTSLGRCFFSLLSKQSESCHSSANASRKPLTLPNIAQKKNLHSPNNVWGKFWLNGNKI